MTATIVKLSPGQRDQLARRGYRPEQVGRPFNTAPAIPKNSTELEEMLNDPAKAGPVLKDTKSLTEFIGSYAKQQQGEGTELSEAVKAELQRELANFLREHDLKADATDTIKRLNLDPQTRPRNMLSTHRQATAYNAAAPGAAFDSEYKDATDFVRAIWHLNKTPEAVARRARIEASFGSVVPSDGGFLVPETLRSQLLEIALEQAVVRPRATVVPMESARVPFPVIDSTTNATSVYGGMIAFWGEEGAALTDSSAKFGRIELDAKKLTGLSAVPNELLQDSLISFSALIERLWPQALAWYEDVAFMSGSGVGEPLGFLGAANPATIAVTAESTQSAGTIVIENILKMYSRMLPSSLNSAVWIVSPETIPELYTMAISVGTGGAPVMLVNAAGAGPATMLGRPIVISEKAGRIGTQGDVSFADLSYYLVGDRQTMAASSSTDFKFDTDKTTFRIIQRVDGTPWLRTPITPQNGGNTLSPFVQIAAR